MAFRYKCAGFNILENKWMDRTFGFLNYNKTHFTFCPVRNAFYFTLFPPKLKFQRFDFVII